MNRPKLSATIAAVGFAAMVSSVLMAFLADHHWYVTYQIALLFEGMWGWAQLTGAGLAIIGSIGMAFYVTRKNTFRVGVALIILGLLLSLVFGGSIFNIHDWAISLLLPVMLSLFAGTVLAVGGKRS